MLTTLYNWLPTEGVNLLLVLFLAFLIGLEREERKADTGQYVFGGVRTFPLIGLIGYTIAYLSGGNLVPLATGFAVVGAFLLMSYWHKLAKGDLAGITTEMSGLVTYLVGPLVYANHLWFATALSVAAMLLLELKAGLEGLTRRVASDDILTFTKFLLLTVIILPLLPNENFTQFQINPYKTWLIVAAVSTVSYASYVLQRLSRGRDSALLAAVLGGAYSSTVTTIVFSRRAAQDPNPHLYAGGILIASGMMYLRLAALLALFNQSLMRLLAPAFIVLGVIALGAGWLWSARGDASAGGTPREFETKNPLEIGAALVFAVIYLAMLVATHYAVTYLGNTGVYSLAAVMGVTDVDPFIMGITQAAGTVTPLGVGASSIAIAAASNNLVKGIYAYSLAPRAVGVQSLVLLAALAALGLVPLVW
jgi:uncharacterized membrane protein (DUF4010 family)